MPLNFKKLVAIFASKFFRFSGTIGKCAAKPSRAGGFLPLTAFRLNRALVAELPSILFSRNFPVFSHKIPCFRVYSVNSDYL